MPTADRYLEPSPGGRVFASVDAARRESLRPGDTVLLRSLGQAAPPEVYAPGSARGKWRLRPYRLADGQRGELLMVEDRDVERPESVVPPGFEVALDLPGWYAIWFGVPRIDLKPILQHPIIGGVDAALDDDPAFVHVSPERGARRGQLMGPRDVEVMCFWKCAPLAGRTLRLRPPYGTFHAIHWGHVRASLSAIRLVRLSDEQVEAYRRDVADPATKRVYVANDGFSHYWFCGDPRNGSDIDRRFAQQYRDGDVRGIILQAPSTCAPHWPSRIEPPIGGDVPPEKWGLMRRGDRRACEYVRWAVDHGQEGLRVIPPICREAGMEFHAGLRLSLFFRNTGIFGGAIEEMNNGRLWRQRPDLRASNGVTLDYAQPEVREHILGLLMEMAQYDVDGLSLDFTRWPPIADPPRHDFNVLTSFVLEARRRLDQVARRKGRKLMLSAAVVDGYHAFATLAAQKIDLEAWLTTGALDFVCVQAWDHTAFRAAARKNGVPYFAVLEMRSQRVPGNVEDPDWRQDDRVDEDPLPGEELEDAPHVNNALDPTECDEVALRWFNEGIDGVYVCNNFMGWRSTSRLGHADELAERVRSGKVWAQEVGASIVVLDLERLEASLEVVRTPAASGGDRTGRLRLTLRNVGPVPARGSASLDARPAEKARLVDASPWVYGLDAGQQASHEFQFTALAGAVGKVEFRTRSDSPALFPQRVGVYLDWSAPRVGALASPNEVEIALAGAVGLPAMLLGRPIAQIRLGVAGLDLAVWARVWDRRVRQGAPEPWDGSCVEVFGSMPGAACVGQVYLLPQDSERPARGLRETGAQRPIEPRIRVASRSREDGYDLFALAPLELLAIEPSSEAFLIESQVTAARDVAGLLGRATLFGSRNAYCDNRRYARVVVSRG